MSVEIRKQLTPKEARERLGISDSKFKRLAQLGYIPSIPMGTRGEHGEKGPAIRLYDENVIEQIGTRFQDRLSKNKEVDPNHYSTIRRKGQEGQADARRSME